MVRPFLLIIQILLVLTYGCATQNFAWKANNPVASVENEYFQASIKLTDHTGYGGGYDGFILIVENKINEDIEIAWDKSYCIIGGQSYGKMMLWDGNSQLQSDMVFANQIFKRYVYPEAYGHLLPPKEDWGIIFDPGGWWHAPMPEGDDGIYLTIFVGDYPIREKLTIPIKKIPF